MAVLTVRGLNKTYVMSRSILGRPKQLTHAVRDVAFSIEAGQTLALVGESGAGKSTVGRLILRLIEPDSGEVWLGDVNLLKKPRKELKKFRARARMIFQDPFSSLDPRMDIASSLSEPLEIHTRLSRQDRRRSVIELLHRVGLREQHLERYPHEFSGGQLQRIAVARAIATNPDIVVCDEPVAALDMSIRAQVINLLRDLQDERGIAYLFISHDLSLVRMIADFVMVMYAGSIVESGPTEQIFRNPTHAYTRMLLAAVPVTDPARRFGRSSSVAMAGN